MVPTKMPTSTDAPMAALQTSESPKAGTIWVSATPMSDST